MFSNTLKPKKGVFLSTLLLWCVSVALPNHVFAQSPDKRCLYVSSYDEGNEWSDAIEASIRASLTGHCEVRKIDMNTKHVTSLDAIFEVANHIINTIEEWNPHVVLTSDENAAKYLITPHYRDDKIPFVFSGINWTVEEYGFPYTNVTGIVEVAPLKAMLKEALRISSYGRKAVFIAPDDLSEKKNFSRLKEVASEFSIQIEPLYYSSFSQWKNALQSINEYDFAVMGSSASIKDWDTQSAKMAALKFIQKPTFTTDMSMMPYATFGFTNLANEQGEWTASVAIRILNGVDPNEIPLATNKKWEFWVNEEIFDKLETPLSRRLLRKGKRIQISALEE